MLQVQLGHTTAAKELIMYPTEHLPGTLIATRPRNWGACRALGIYVIVCLLVPSTWTLAATHVDSNAVQAEQSGPSIGRDIPETGPWQIMRIVPPENIQELGTAIFGEGESLLEPSALRGPR